MGSTITRVGVSDRDEVVVVFHGFPAMGSTAAYAEAKAIFAELGLPEPTPPGVEFKRFKAGVC